ncbi:hypothetical protein U9M48_006371 [Paspalum notatum var. saurae]|uniref:PHD-type zinc finger plants domain-containing protein n=1 Tax=Paspalum notatum var. saurae TaxID=547442 RepID=A0AAQ3PZJ0_PASNO
MASHKLSLGGSPPGAAAAAVCCMCGDPGLLPELFRCSACSVRTQHTYCTERYPKLESYDTCNWCNRAEGSGAASASTSPRPSSSKAAAAAARPPPAPHGGGDTHTTTTTSGGRSPKVAARGDFASSNLSNKPIKKQQQRLLLRRSASDLGSRVRTTADHNAPPSPGVARGRPRVRRYKLLEEVITS